MKTSIPKWIFITVFAVGAVLVVLALRRSYVRSQPPARQVLDFSQRPLAERARFIENEGVMLASDYIQKEQILNSVEKNGTISDADLAWVLHMLQSPGPSQDPVASEVGRGKYFEVLQLTKHYTPAQKPLVFQVMVNFVKPQNRNDQLRSMSVLRHLGDSRAVPYIMPLRNDPDPDVRRAAERSLVLLNSPAAATMDRTF